MGDSSKIRGPGELILMASNYEFGFTFSTIDRQSLEDSTGSRKLEDTDSSSPSWQLHDSLPCFTHNTKLPSLDGCFDDAMSQFDIDISPWRDPVEWIQGNTIYINQIIEAVIKVTENSALALAFLSGEGMIYPVSICHAIIRILNLISHFSVSAPILRRIWYSGQMIEGKMSTFTCHV